jgi:hypothetical protein
MMQLPPDLIAFIVRTADRQNLGTLTSPTFIYRDTVNKILFVMVRFEKSSENGVIKSFRPFRKRAHYWSCSDPSGLLPLFMLPRIVSADRVFVVEGEKCAIAAAKLGLAATCSSHGANAAHKTDWRPLRGKEVVILPDNDQSGERYADSVLSLLRKLDSTPKVKVVRLADLWRTEDPLPAGGDIVDWLDSGVPETWDRMDCRNCIERAVAAKALEPVPAIPQVKPLPARPPSVRPAAARALEPLPANPDLKPLPTKSPSARAPATVIERAAKYLAKCPGSISGQGGNRQACHIAKTLIKGFALTPSDAYQLMTAWNQGSVPPWSADELRGFLRWADETPDSEPRGKLNEPPPKKPRKPRQRRRTSSAFDGVVFDEPE